MGLRLATNGQSKVFGVSLKDRAAILPAGSAANAAYWIDSKSGAFITSTASTNRNCPIGPWPSMPAEKRPRRSQRAQTFFSQFPLDSVKPMNNFYEFVDRSPTANEYRETDPPASSSPANNSELTPPPTY